jgi:hypothetical protein
MGDILDRGGWVRDVLDLLMRLQDEAGAAGGQVIVLLGNHEIMDLLGVIREIHPEAWASFADEQSEQRRAAALQDFKRFQLARARSLGIQPPEIGDEMAEQWLASYPLGKIEYMEAFLPGGTYGRWLRQCPTIVRIGDTVLVHAGLSPALKGMSLEQINRRVWDELAAFDDIRWQMVEHHLVQPTSSVHLMVNTARPVLERMAHQQQQPRQLQRLHQALEKLLGWESWFLADRNGPLWYPGPAIWDEAEDRQEVAELLDSFAARYLVAAHIPSRDGRIRSRFGARVLVIDTGIEHHRYQGREAALEIQGGVVTAIYPHARVVLASGETGAGAQ